MNAPAITAVVSMVKSLCISQTASGKVAALTTDAIEI
jgi:hypothetical protein